MSLIVKGTGSGRDIVTVTPQSAQWRHVGFAARRLARGETLKFDTGTTEVCVVVLTGVVSVRTADDTWRDIGARRSVFDTQSPYAVYLPPRTAVSIDAHDTAELALASAPAEGLHRARLIDPGKMTRSVRGSGTNTRYVCDILPQSELAESLLVVEVLTPAGHSSSYPPHKHDVDAVRAESFLEETYYHRLNPSQGFAFQRVYTDSRDIDEALAVEDHDVVMVPRGYHPVVMPHGYDGYYLNVMAGPRRAWHFRNDPAHEWMLSKQGEAAKPAT
ncbi:5-deoxy-glucuronate isomerase [Paraburkholderia rhynchosiae]|uniref:5-deoxy-glucuronate isomerase n=1 Tax=Paraburkholderia rhynchosiae TaxID=487049 RepID=A0A2N7WDL4_9BURK|nr:5-deoxy-glucuronate isomerase [Paraburkholderia rhynchosiae]PMS27464.1 5-deoxy-glucuronate isomerase [Paraburkholderia rhynchosiae]CAB3724158.1 5-deoxy-glucuronate isomerase [Paraburkholderia rhynchosiae]